MAHLGRDLMRADLLVGGQTMPGRHHRDQRLFDHEFEGDAGCLHFTPQERHVHVTAHQRAGQIGGWLAGESNLDGWLLRTQDAECVRKPDHLVTGQEADHERRLRRLCSAARCLACGFDLKQC
jgi:hypothetical protein